MASFDVLRSRTSSEILRVARLGYRSVVSSIRLSGSSANTRLTWRTPRMRRLHAPDRRSIDGPEGYDLDPGRPLAVICFGIRDWRQLGVADCNRRHRRGRGHCDFDVWYGARFDCDSRRIVQARINDWKPDERADEHADDEESPEERRHGSVSARCYGTLFGVRQPPELSQCGDSMRCSAKKGP